MLEQQRLLFTGALTTMVAGGPEKHEEIVAGLRSVMASKPAAINAFQSILFALANPKRLVSIKQQAEKTGKSQPRFPSCFCMLRAACSIARYRSVFFYFCKPQKIFFYYLPPSRLVCVCSSPSFLVSRFGKVFMRHEITVEVELDIHSNHSSFSIFFCETKSCSAIGKVNF